MGWNFSVYRQEKNRLDPAPTTANRVKPLAVWTAHVSGLRWIEELVKTGRAVSLGGNFYPSFYTAKVQHLIPPIMDKPPEARTEWQRDLGDAAPGDWSYEKAGLDRAAVADCSPDEWLLVQVWDRS